MVTTNTEQTRSDRPDYEVPDEARLGGVVGVRGVHLHRAELLGLDVHRGEGFHAVDLSFEDKLSVGRLCLRHHDGRPLADRWWLVEVHGVGGVAVDGRRHVHPEVRMEEDGRRPVPVYGLIISVGCQVDKARPVIVVVVGGLEVEGDPPLLAKGGQGGEQVGTNHRKLLLRLLLVDYGQAWTEECQFNIGMISVCVELFCNSEHSEQKRK